ncbi:low molecular weight protein-tyrosine-phosphatase [Mucilaginibacter auburnensis]|nr:low molecular weight protein-tyrosine-phosphatase [Mucilaginibacter auburnensis]
MKILMVCLGNICRSPLAEGIMQHLADRAGLNWTVDSAGTGSWHIGEAPDRRSVKVARSYGVDISKQVCRQFTPADFDEFDHILVMDRSNLSNVLNMARNQADKAKVSMLLGADVVPDPYYDDTLFDPVNKLIEQGCKNFIEKFK